ncbi:MAG TPA: DEAD/DEAH box helicase [Candidatus Acidoferrales bacterium]|nr:DEAD/DEAH box helicase [Candidatus Acidoferrales bacterium]
MNSPVATFEELALTPAMLAALKAAGYIAPTPIQAHTIQPALAGRDVIGAAQTGTGKTAAFIIPIVERLRAAGTHGTALVLAPTRELAEQILGWAERLGCGLRATLVVGGVGYGPQLQGLRGRPSIIVATPGRLVDHLERGTVGLQQVRTLVLDEADRMLDMGFKPQLDRILRALPTPRQTLLFSATLPPDLSALVRMHLRDPIRAEIGPQAVPPSRANQDVYLVGHEAKTPLLLSLIEGAAGNVLVFARTKHRTDRVARAVRNAGHAAQPLHSDRSQSQRREALEGFRRGRYRILIATDIAARGIDVPGIHRVINYDLPQTVEDYVHRVGRTARAGANGHASSFASPDERAQLHAIERHLGRALPRQSHDTPGTCPVVISESKEVRHEQGRHFTAVWARPVGHHSRQRRARQG